MNEIADECLYEWCRGDLPNLYAALTQAQHRTEVAAVKRSLAEAQDAYDIREYRIELQAWLAELEAGDG